VGDSVQEDLQLFGSGRRDLSKAQFPFVRLDVNTIQEEHVPKYGGLSQRYRTVDREIDSYLRCVASGHHEYSRETDWHFLWRGQIVELSIEQVEAGSDRKGHLRDHKRVMRLDIPDALSTDRDEIILNLRRAFEAYKGDGVFSEADTYELQLDFEEE
jgi:hypothetical protein